MPEILLVIALILLVAVLALQVLLLFKKVKADLSPLREVIGDVEKNYERAERTVREEMAKNREETAKTARHSRDELGTTLKEGIDTLNKQLAAQSQASDQKLGKMRETIEQSLRTIQEGNEKKLDQMRRDAAEGGQKTREETKASLKEFNESVGKRIDDFVQWQRVQFGNVIEQLKGLTDTNEKRLTEVRKTVEERLKGLQEDNSKNLEKMRQTVDEKLEGTLEKRLGESFKLVSERLEQVYKGLGEMQKLAAGVGDLKKVLTNVKARGTWGEVQLGAMLEQILTLDQYDTNVATKGGDERVEFAVKLPGRGDAVDEVVWLPIDAKFPIEDYQRLLEAQEKADVEAAEAAAKQLEIRVKGCAKDISDKYVSPPNTTDFGILYLPMEGLFAEVIRRPGLPETIQRDYRVVVAGPTTLWSVLNSLQMGFRTLAIEKRSSEVWSLLAAVKTEFGKYGAVLDKVQKKLQQASNTIDSAAVRSRAIERKLRDVQELPAMEAGEVLQLADATVSGDEQDEEE